MLIGIAGQTSVGIKDGWLESGRAFIRTFTYQIQDGPSGKFHQSTKWGGHGVSPEDTSYVMNKTRVLVERGLELSPEKAPGLGGRKHLRE